MIFRVLRQHLLPEQYILPIFIFSWNCVGQFTYSLFENVTIYSVTSSLYSICLRYLRRTIMLRLKIFFPYFICLRYLGRTILFYLNIMFFHISFISDIWEEPYYFPLIISFSIFDLFQIPGKIILLRFNNVFLYCSYVRYLGKEPYYFVLTVYFSIFHLSRISDKNHIASP